MRQTAILLNWIIIALVLGSCGASQRQKAIRYSLVSVNAARDGFVTWDRQYQLAIVERATSREDGASKLIAYRKDREPIEKAFEVVYRSIATAAILNADDRSWADAIDQAMKLKIAVEEFIAARRDP